MFPLGRDEGRSRSPVAIASRAQGCARMIFRAHAFPCTYRDCGAGVGGGPLADATTFVWTSDCIPTSTATDTAPSVARRGMSSRGPATVAIGARIAGWDGLTLLRFVGKPRESGAARAWSADRGADGERSGFQRSALPRPAGAHRVGRGCGTAHIGEGGRGAERLLRSALPPALACRTCRGSGEPGSEAPRARPVPLRSLKRSAARSDGASGCRASRIAGRDDLLFRARTECARCDRGFALRCGSACLRIAACLGDFPVAARHSLAVVLARFVRARARLQPM